MPQQGGSALLVQVALTLQDLYGSQQCINLPPFLAQTHYQAAHIHTQTSFSPQYQAKNKSLSCLLCHRVYCNISKQPIALWTEARIASGRCTYLHVASEHYVDTVAEQPFTVTLLNLTSRVAVLTCMNILGVGRECLKSDTQLAPHTSDPRECSHQINVPLFPRNRISIK